VGQGQCVLVQSKDDCYVVDCGGFSDLNAADLAAQTLRSCGVQKVDGLLLTHFDYDHAGYAESFLSQMNVQKIYVPNADADNDIRKNLELQYADQLEFVDDVVAFDCGVGDLTIYPAEAGKDGNESSLCILFQARECDILITGDRGTLGETMLLHKTQLPKLEVLIAGHHGSAGSTGEKLLAQTMPEYVLISVGKNNRYGHPADSLLERIQKYGATIYRTDQNGTIIFRR
jgi:competence protein ComEC